MKKQTPVEMMLNLVSYLPKKDIKHAQRLIANRDFETLYDLVLSDVKKAEAEPVKEEDWESSAIAADKVKELFTVVNEYLTLLDPNWMLDNVDYSEYNEEENECLENYCLMLVGKLMRALIEKTQR